MGLVQIPPIRLKGKIFFKIHHGLGVRDGGIFM
jgi:hypothetical protein